MTTSATRKRTTTRSKGDESCYYANDTCEGETWQCLGCQEHYCQAHSHVSAKGHNKECVACERERKDAELLAEEERVERSVAKTDVLDKLDIADK
jgi:hypothetical protein